MGLAKCIYRLMILFGSGLRLRCFCSALVASFVLLFCNTASADNFNWLGYGSANGACSYLANSGASSGILLLSYHFEGSTAATGTCYAKYGPPTGGSWPEHSVGSISRAGSGCAEGMVYSDTEYQCIVPPPPECPPGTSWNSVTGACGAVVEPNKCELLKDTVIKKFKWTSPTDTPGASISIGGCAATIGGVTICLNTPAGKFSCTGTATITGDELVPVAGTTSGECTGAACNEGEPQKTSTEDPCVAIPAGSGFTCSSTKTESTPGTTQCGTANGAWVCSEKPKSSSSTSKSNISQSSTANPDGSTTTQTTTTTTTTNCHGLGNCTTGTTTNVTSGGTNSNGTNKPPSNSCTGPECSGGSVGGGSSGNGTGSEGEGEGEGEGEEEEPPPADVVSGDMACAAVVACTGEVIQCAILRQEQQSRCADMNFRDVSSNKVAELKTDLNAEFSGADYQPIKPTAASTFSLEGMIDTSSRFGAACPILPLISYTWIDGTGRNFDPNVPGLCTFLTFLGYLNVAFAMRKAAEIIASGVR